MHAKIKITLKKKRQNVHSVTVHSVTEIGIGVDIFGNKMEKLVISFYIQLKSSKNCLGMGLLRNHTRENKNHTGQKEAKCPLRYRNQ